MTARRIGLHDTCSSKWPDIFTHPRPFAGVTQSQRPFLQHLRTLRGSPNFNDDETDDDSDTISRDSESGESRLLQGDRQHTMKGMLPFVRHHLDLELGLSNDRWSRRVHPMRQFLSVITGLEQSRLHLDEDVVIAAYREYEACRLVDDGSKDEQLIAIVDIRANSGGDTNGLNGASLGRQLGGLTPTQLREELGIPMVRLENSPSLCYNSCILFFHSHPEKRRALT